MSKRLNIMLYSTKTNDYITLPVNPESVELKYAKNSETFEILDFGQINIMGNPKAMEIIIKDILPEDDSPFVKNSGILLGNSYGTKYAHVNYSSKKAVGLFKKWALEKSKIRFVMDNEINIPCYVESFTQNVMESALFKPFSLHIKEIRTPLEKKSRITGLIPRIFSMPVPLEILMKAGDTIYSIADKYGLDFKVLAKNNNIKDVNANLEGLKLSVAGGENENIYR